VTVRELENRLQEVQILKPLTYPALRRLVQNGRFVSVKAGEIIIGPRFGTRGAWVLLEGSVSVVLPFGPVVAYLEPGKMFGEIALLDGVERSAYCKAYMDCLLFEIPFEIFHTDLVTNPAVLAGMEQLALNRLNTNQAIIDGAFKPDLEPPEPEQVEAEIANGDEDGPAVDGTLEPAPAADAPKPPAVYATA
jgi:CRP-like cAMP-binding protein